MSGVISLKRLTKIVNRGASPVYDDFGTAKFINQACIYWTGVKELAIKPADESKHRPGSRGYLEKGDILVNSTGTGTLGRAAIFNKDNDGSYFADSHVTIVRPDPKVLDSSYAKYVIQTDSFQDKIYTFCVSGSTNQIELSRERFRELELGGIEVHEQKKLADYLDTKTQTLDKALIAKGHLLDLLEAQKRAAIFNLTTRGIDSGGTLRKVPEEWLGSVPESWQQTYLMGCAYERKRKNYPGNIPTLLSLSYGKLITKDVEDNGGLLPESFDTYQLITAGQIVLRLTDLQNDHKSLRVGYATQDGMITSAYSCVTAKDEVLPKYLYYYLHSADLRKVFYSMGGGVRQSMKFADLKRLVMYIPDKITQQEIVDAIENKVEQIEKLQDKVKKSINLLEEYRSSLISNVVGGKVEV